MPKDAIALLKEDHKKVRGLLSELEETTERSPKKREKLLGEIEMELTIHTQIEEEIFYPAFRDAVSKKDDKQMFYEAKEEHHVVKLVLPEVKACDPSTVQFAARSKVLKELVEHHADEEEDDMFPAARKAMEASKLKDLGARMLERKEELKASMS